MSDPRVFRRFVHHRGALVGVVFLLLVALASLLAGVLAADPESMDLTAANTGPSARHWFGTDENGRDVLSRTLAGARVSCAVALASMAIAITLGTLLGGVGGYFGGWLDRLVAQAVDGMQAVPLFFLWVLALTSLGSSTEHVVLVIGATSWMVVARVVRGDVLRVREMDYVQAARALGVPDGRLLLRHVLPQVVPSIVVGASLSTAFALLSEAALSYLGVGVQPPRPSWGNMLSSAQQLVWDAPWVAVFPGVGICLTVLAFNAIADALRDAFDPQG